MFCDNSDPAQLHFNPRPRKEGDAICETAKYCVKSISIHALAKRATDKLIMRSNDEAISIHALAKRATLTEYHSS